MGASEQQTAEGLAEELAQELLTPDGGKVFAGLYALYAGLVFLVASGLVFAPVVHRVLHRFLWEQDR